MAAPGSSDRRIARAARSSCPRRLGVSAWLLGALVGVVVLAGGCGTAAASDGAAAAASSSPSAATRIGPLCSCGPTSAAAALASAHVGDLDVNAGYAVTSVLSLDGRTTTAAYMSIANEGLKPADLLGASSPKATSVDLANSTHSGSNDAAAVDSIPIAAGGTVALAPDGYKLTVVGLPAPLRIGDMLPVTLHFSGGRTAHLTLPVESR